MADYEAEYNNRARVPEHPAIFARWTTEAAAYRRHMAARQSAELGVIYGPSPRQFADLFFPESGRPSAFAVFVHGGYWRSLDPSLFSHMARGLNARGIAVAVAGYDLCPQVRVADIVEQMRRACLFLWRHFGARLLVFGHSAGGHLAAAMLATNWSLRDADAPDDLVPAASAISGVFDLVPLVGISMNDDLRLSLEEARAVSPLFWPAPRGRILDVLVGADESSEFLRQSRSIADAWGAAGVTVRHKAIANANHFTVIDPLDNADSAMVLRLAELASAVAGR
jgi:arylformamidase